MSSYFNTTAGVIEVEWINNFDDDLAATLVNKKTYICFSPQKNILQSGNKSNSLLLPGMNMKRGARFRPLLKRDAD